MAMTRSERQAHALARGGGNVDEQTGEHGRGTCERARGATGAGIEISLTQRTGFLLSTLGRRFRAATERALAPLSITPAQYGILAVLGRAWAGAPRQPSAQRSASISRRWWCLWTTWRVMGWWNTSATHAIAGRMGAS